MNMHLAKAKAERLHPDSKENQTVFLEGVNWTVKELETMWVILIDSGDDRDYTEWVHGVYNSFTDANEEKLRIWKTVGSMMEDEKSTYAAVARGVTNIIIKQIKSNTPFNDLNSVFYKYTTEFESNLITQEEKDARELSDKMATHVRKSFGIKEPE